MKKQFILLSSLITGLAYSQVGIYTETPKATLDVAASPSDITKVDGFIAPRLKGSELKAKDANYDVPQTGAIVYVTEALAATATTPKTAQVRAIGYFMFDGSIWQPMAADIRMIHNSLGTNHLSQDAGNGSNGTSLGTGLNNIAIGKDALMSNTTGMQNIAIGVNALKSNTTGNGNLVISNSEGTFESSGASNTTGNYNLVLGGDAFTANTSGEYNIAIGGASLYENTTGNYNTAIGGLWTMGQNKTGLLNTAIGVEALTSMNVGVGNTAIGASALYNFIGDNNTNSVGNIGLGYNSGNNLRSGKNNILIGLNAEAKVSPTGSNQLNIGNWIYGDNGKIGLGTATIPTNTLHISGGTTNPVRFEGLQASVSGDRLVTVDATGVLKQLNVNYATTAVATGETWINGKKIYRKVYPVLLTSFSSVANITIDPGLGAILDAQFAMTLDNGVYKRHFISAASYNPTTGILSQGSTVTDGTFTPSTYPITLNLVVTFVEP